MVISDKISRSKSNFGSAFEPGSIVISCYDTNYLSFFTEKMEIIIPWLKKLVFLIMFTITKRLTPLAMLRKRKKNQLL